MEPLRFIELDSDAPEDAGAGRAPEGRLAMAEDPAAELLEAQLAMDHPNGAVDLVDAVLCVARAALRDVERRYEIYLGRPARAEGPARVGRPLRSRRGGARGRDRLPERRGRESGLSRATLPERGVGRDAGRDRGAQRPARGARI